MLAEKSNPVRLAILGIAFALAIAANANDAAARSPDPEMDQAKARSLTPVDILIDWQAEPTYLGIYYAKQKGDFERAGFLASITQSWGANQAVAAVASGKYIIGTASGGATVLGRNNGAGVVSTAVLYPHVPSVIYGLASTGVKIPADLKGKRIGIYPGSITVNEFDAFLKLNGLRRTDLDVVSLSGADIPLLLAGRVDAVLHYTEMSPVQVETSQNVPGPSPKTFELLLANYGVGGYGLNVIVNESRWHAEQPQLKVLTSIIVDGYRKGCTARDDAVNEFMKEFPDKDRNYVSASWNRVCNLIGSNPGAQDVAGWQKTIDLYRSLGLLHTDVTPAQVMGQ